MRIIVRAKAGAKKVAVEKLSQPTLGLLPTEPDIYRVSVKEPPIDGKANDAIIRALGEYFDIAPSRVRLVAGHTAKRKLFEIQE